MPFPRSKLDAYLVFIDNCVNHEALLNQLHQWCVKGCVLEDGTMAESYTLPELFKSSAVGRHNRHWLDEFT